MVKQGSKRKTSFFVSSNTVPSSHVTYDFSDDGRRVRMRSSRPVELPPLVSASAPEAEAPVSNPFDSEERQLLDGSVESYADTVQRIDFEDGEIPGIQVRITKAKRYGNSDAPLTTFLEFREQYLDEVIRGEGRGDYRDASCVYCQTPSPRIRCKECLGGALMCESCAVAQHRRLPLHRIEQWVDALHAFEPQNLRALGLILRLGHPDGSTCLLPKSRTLVVIHTNGMHEVAVVFCDCNITCHFRQQLLRVGWWPGTPLQPHTAATFEVLRMFHYLNLQGNLTAYDFYRGLGFLTDGHMREKLPDREFYFSAMIREWRNVKSLKRSGRGHDPASASGTQAGELSIPCRACPHPGKNIPEGWDRVPTGAAFLFWVFRAFDANFRLKSRYRKTNIQDVCLSPGWAYFVEHRKYLEHVSKYADEQEISTCAGFQALHLANLKRMRGLAATGVAGSACSRHEMWCALGDLQKGERYVNMDYIVATTFLALFVTTIVATYDIACQFFTRFWQRVPSLPAELRPPQLTQHKLICKVPKAHLVGHKIACHGTYSLNFTRGVGRSDGEGIERLWGWLNKAAPSAKEMTACGRRETVDDFCSFANYRKTLTLGDLLARRMLEALKEAAKNLSDHISYESGIRQNHPSALARWEKEIDAYENDPSLPCPYMMVKTDTVTVDEVRLELLKEEEKESREGQISPTASETGPSGFILLGIEIEDAQQQLNFKIRSQTSANTLAQTTRLEQRRALWKRVTQFRKVQATYMPRLSALVPAAEEQARPGWHDSENIPLYLPSSLDARSRKLVCLGKLDKIEERLREAQARQALDELRQELISRVSAQQWKVRNVTGQTNNTRTRSCQKTIDDRIILHKHTYRRARAALLALRGPGEWSRTDLRELADGDVRGYNERAMTEQEMFEREEVRRGLGLVDEEVMAVPCEDGLTLGEGRRSISWLWLAVGPGGLQSASGEQMIHEALRIQWARSKARAERWVEETALLWEEMRRAIQYCYWRAGWWEQQAKRRENVSAELQEGLVAYARQQAIVEQQLAIRWSAKLKPLRRRAEAFLEKTPLAPALHEFIQLLGNNDGLPVVLIERGLNASNAAELIELDLDDLGADEADDDDFE